MDSELPRNPHLMRVVVGEADVDAQGHASNVSVVAWMSQAAFGHSVALGYDAPDYERLGGMFVVRRHVIDYHERARLGEALSCYTWPTGLSKVTAERRHRILRETDGVLIAEGTNVWAYVHMETGRPTRIPRELRDTFDPARFL